MARTLPPTTWQNGFAEPTDIDVWADNAHHLTEEGNRAHYATPPAQEPLTSTIHNDLGLNVLRTWPTMYNGTESPHGVPSWWKPANEVDVLICGGMFLNVERVGLS
jgi:phenol 2-monooxygenase